MNMACMPTGERLAGARSPWAQSPCQFVQCGSLHSFMFTVLEVDHADRRCDKWALVASCCRPAGGSSAAGRAGWMRASTATPNHRSRRRSRPWEPADSMLREHGASLLQIFVETSAIHAPNPVGNRSGVISFTGELLSGPRNSQRMGSYSRSQLGSSLRSGLPYAA